MRNGRSQCVFGKFNIRLELNVINNSLKDLTVSELPESHRKHQIRNILNDIQGQHGHLFVERRWLAVVIAHKKSFVDVQDNEGDTGNRIQRGHCAAVAERDADLKQNGGVSVVNQVLGSSVQIDVGLYRRSFGDEGIASEAAVQAPGEINDRVEHAELDQRPQSL